MPESLWSPEMIGAGRLTRSRVLLTGPVDRSWYLGERVFRWWDGPERRRVPVPPPGSMYWGRELAGDELILAEAGEPAEAFLEPPGLSYIEVLIPQLVDAAVVGDSAPPVRRGLLRSRCTSATASPSAAGPSSQPPPSQAASHAPVCISFFCCDIQETNLLAINGKENEFENLICIFYSLQGRRSQRKRTCSASHTIGEEADVEGGAGASHAGGVASEDIVSGSIVDPVVAMLQGLTVTGGLATYPLPAPDFPPVTFLPPETTHVSFFCFCRVIVLQHLFLICV